MAVDESIKSRCNKANKSWKWGRARLSQTKTRHNAFCLLSAIHICGGISSTETNNFDALAISSQGNIYNVKTKSLCDQIIFVIVNNIFLDKHYYKFILQQVLTTLVLVWLVTWGCSPLTTLLGLQYEE